MIYDKNPPYPHYANLPYAKEPWKTLYVSYRLFTTLLLVPVWVTYYALIPRRYRPRASWNLRQIVNVNFTRRIFKVTEVAGVTWGTRDPTLEPEEGSLRETRFEWVDPLEEVLRTGIVREGGVEFRRVGCFVWPREGSGAVKKARRLRKGSLGSVDDMDLEEGSEDMPIIGIFMHGGGYCHMSAHETSRTSRIPRGLIKKNMMHEIYSVEYRLLQHAPFPAVVQDAAAVYAHVVQLYDLDKCKIVLIGDSSGGNLVLSLARWIRDEGKLPMPHGLLLLSPSCDTSHALPETLSSYIPRPNAHTDYLVDTPEPRALLQRTFLGFSSPSSNKAQKNIEEERRLMQIVHSEYVSPCSPIVLKRWGHELKQDPEGEHERNFVRSVFRRLPTDLRKARGAENLGAGVDVDTDNAALLASTASVLDTSSSTAIVPTPQSTTQPADPSTSTSTSTSTENPYRKTSRFPSLFASFPRTLIICGTAERLTREIRSLISAMQKDGVDTEVVWARDACHDVLIIVEGWWDREVVKEVWEGVGKWVKGFGRGAGAGAGAGAGTGGHESGQEHEHEGREGVGARDAVRKGTLEG